MGSGTLTDVVSGNTAGPSDVNQLIDAMQVNLVPRNSSGAAANLAGDLGESALRWKKLWIETIDLDGEAVDVSELVTEQHRIKSGRTHANHNGPRFLLPDGTAAECTIKAGGANPDLVVVIDGVEVTVSSDIILAGLSTAPSSNNTALINDSDLSDQDETKQLGEWEVCIGGTEKRAQWDVDNVGSEITSLVFLYNFFQINNGSSTEVVFGRYVGSGIVERIVRGFGYDSSENDEVPIAFSNNDTVTLLQANWIFLDQDGSTTYTTEKYPARGGEEPGSPASNDYWFDTAAGAWKRYNGSAWVEVARHLLGVAICDSSGCKWAFSSDFFFRPQQINTLQIEEASSTQVETNMPNGLCHVYGNLLKVPDFLAWDIASHLDTGESETSSTEYFIYLTDDQKPVISAVHPRRPDLRGDSYHPHKPWLCVGHFYNDGSGDIETGSGFNQTDWLWLAQQNGVGSTNASVLRWSIIVLQRGAALHLEQSSSLGDIVTVRRSGLYAITARVPERGNGGVNGGIFTRNASKNATISNLLTANDNDVLASHFVEGETPGQANEHITVTAIAKMIRGQEFWVGTNNAGTFQSTEGYLRAQKILDILAMGGQYNNYFG